MSDAPVRRALVFGATGQIGRAIAAAFCESGYLVWGASRGGSDVPGHRVTPLAYDAFEAKGEIRPRLPQPFDTAFDAVVWAQGRNCNDSLLEFDLDQHLEILKANAVYVAVSLAALLRERLLAHPSRLCVISSIWQTIARQNKLSYTVSKAAIQGLVLSAAADLGAQGHLINAIMPGALDTPMTRAMLTTRQREDIERQTYFARLPTLQDVAELAVFLCSAKNTSITGQFMAVDLGFQHVRLV